MDSKESSEYNHLHFRHTLSKDVHKFIYAVLINFKFPLIKKDTHLEIFSFLGRT